MTVPRSLECGSDPRAGTLRPAHTVLLLIAATAIVRIVFAASLGLGIDESYTVATGRHPQLSYFDHPPLAWWLAWGSARLFGTEAALAVRLPFIVLFAVTTWLMFALAKLLFGERAGVWAAATLNLAPVLAWTSGTWVLPDGPLNMALLAGAYCVASAVFGERSAAPLWWLAAGACAGLALLSKLHGVFLLAGVGLFLVASRQHRHWLLNPWPYAGCALAVAMFLPVIIWNAQHDWVSFAFQAGRARVQEIRPWAPLSVLAGQAAYLLPWLWLPLVIALGTALRRGPADDRRWLLACLAIGPIILFTLVAWSGSRVFPHWAMPGYLMLFPLLGASITRALEAAHRLVKYWLIATTASLALIVSAVVALAHLPWPPDAVRGYQALKNPLEEAIDWTDLATALKARGLMGSPRLFIVATRWHEAGKIDYALRGKIPVTCLCKDPRGYGVLARPAADANANALIIGRGLPPDLVQRMYGNHFEGIEMLASVTIKHAGTPAFELSVYRVRGFRPSERDRDPKGANIPSGQRWQRGTFAPATRAAGLDRSASWPSPRREKNASAPRRRRRCRPTRKTALDVGAYPR